MCTVRIAVIPFGGYIVQGSCGEELRLAASEELLEAKLPTTACDTFRAKAMAAFGPRQQRAAIEPPYMPDGLGKRPGARVEDAERLEAFEAMRRAR
jgi:hypothetical protein